MKTAASMINGSFQTLTVGIFLVIPFVFLLCDGAMGGDCTIYCQDLSDNCKFYNESTQQTANCEDCKALADALVCDGTDFSGYLYATSSKDGTADTSCASAPVPECSTPFPSLTALGLTILVLMLIVTGIYIFRRKRITAS